MSDKVESGFDRSGHWWEIIIFSMRFWLVTSDCGSALARLIPAALNNHQAMGETNSSGAKESVPADSRAGG